MALDWPVELLVLLSVNQCKSGAINGTDPRESSRIDFAFSQTIMRWEGDEEVNKPRKVRQRGNLSRKGQTARNIHGKELRVLKMERDMADRRDADVWVN